MMILAMLLLWGVMLAMIIVATCISLIRLKQPMMQDSYNQWHPTHAYEWEPKR